MRIAEVLIPATAGGDLVDAEQHRLDPVCTVDGLSADDPAAVSAAF